MIEIELTCNVKFVISLHFVTWNDIVKIDEMKDLMLISMFMPIEM